MVFQAHELHEQSLWARSRSRIKSVGKRRDADNIHLGYMKFNAVNGQRVLERGWQTKVAEHTEGQNGFSEESTNFFWSTREQNGQSVSQLIFQLTPSRNNNYSS
jgi:hypothetical protein